MVEVLVEVVPDGTSDVAIMGLELMEAFLAKLERKWAAHLAGAREQGRSEGLREAADVVCKACDAAEASGREEAATALARAAEAIALL